MENTKFISEVEDLKLLPTTRDFFDCKVSKGITVFIFSVITLITGLIIWSCLARMDDVVKATAVLRPIDNISELKILSTGEVVEKKYVQNQKVSKGDLLLSIDSTSEQIELINLNESIEKLMKEIADNSLLLAYIKEDSKIINASQSLKDKVDSYNAEHQKLRLQVIDLKDRYDLQINLPQNMKTAAKEDEARLQYEQAVLSMDSFKANKIINLSNQVEADKDRLQSLQLRRNVLQRTIKNSSLYSPIDGYVNEAINLNTGDYIVAGTDILRVIPGDNERLKAEIVLNAADIARVKVGQEVNLRFPGLPPSSFGQLKGKINLIPADITVNSNNPVFVIEADIPVTYLQSSKGDKINLRSGLSAEARVIVAKDTVIKMILKKLDFVN